MQRKVGRNEVYPVANLGDISEDGINVAAYKYISGDTEAMKHMGSDSESEEKMDTKDTKKTVAARKKAIKFIYKAESPDSPQTEKMMPMYIKIKQMSLFPSIY